MSIDIEVVFTSLWKKRTDLGLNKLKMASFIVIVGRDEVGHFAALLPSN